MTRHCLAAKDDCEIVRDHPDGPEEAVVLDLQGEVVFAVSRSWTNHQIWSALDVVNDAYSRGLREGADRKASEIRMAIDAVGNVPSLGSKT